MGCISVYLVNTKEQEVMKEALLRADEEKEYWFEEGCHILEVVNDGDDEAISIARARVEPGDTTQWHFLEGVTERYLILAGRGKVEVGETLCQEVGPADVVRIPPGMKQRISNLGSEDLVFYAICTPRFTIECYRSLDGEDGQRKA